MSLKGSKTTSDYLEWEKMQTLVLKLERDKDYKFALLIACGSYLGLRISDLLTLRWDNLISQDYLVIKEKKTGKTRKLTIHPELQDILQRMYANLNPQTDQLLFINRFKTKAISVQFVNERLKSIFTKYKIKGQFSSHFMRKTLGRRCWAANNYSEQALIMLSSLFNHANLTTTKLYLGIREDEISNLYLSL